MPVEPPSAYYNEPPGRKPGGSCVQPARVSAKFRTSSPWDEVDGSLTS